MGILASILSGLLQGFLGLFGMSDAQKLGRSQVTAEMQDKTIQEVRLGKEVQDSVDALHDGDAGRVLREKWHK